MVRRSNLTIPGNNVAKMLAKGLETAADVLILDLEDSVPVSEKETARESVRQALKNIPGTTKEIAVRINGLTTAFAYDDLIMAAATGAHAIIIPKSESTRDILFADRVLGEVEKTSSKARKTMIHILIESAKGVQSVDEISRCSERITALVFGIGDYFAEIGAKFSSIADADTVCLYPRTRILIAAAAAGVDALDSVFPNFKDPEGLKADAHRGLKMGFKGKWVIHPSQIDVVNEIFTPSIEELKRARAVIETYEKAKAEGKGAVVFQNQMVDEAVIRIAQRRCDAARKLGLWERIGN